LKNYRNIFIKLLISGIILYLLFLKIEFSYADFLNILHHTRLEIYLLSLPGVIIVLAVKAFRWTLIISQTGSTYRFIDAFKAYMISFSPGIITPGRFGEFVKVYDLRESVQMNFENGLKTVFVDRLFDMMILLWLGLAAFLNYLKITGGFVHYAILPVSFVLIIGAALIIQFILKKLIKRQRKVRLFNFLKESIDMLISRQSVIIWAITFIAYLIFYYAIQIILISMDIQLTFLDIVYVFSLVSLVLLLPVSIAGFGTREASLVFLLSFYGISAEAAITFSFLQFTAFFVWGGAVGSLFLIFSPLPVKTIIHDSKKIVLFFKKV